ncbi:hypothetical protein GPECTOR_16g536 [Gonium pectorale]|uniref:Uncharacterized protein n=1 Tax=Gonium pectorale TaxID=33097 RepID=A0A150GKL6_GONPE|nr:hypothetical protein GPECTOR_16g536 [Gonium pectorale]|eukprot:KXZ50363.1 hypothetical protein GPECTOR_16g536 [Gonium pectorale]
MYGQGPPPYGQTPPQYPYQQQQLHHRRTAPQPHPPPQRDGDGGGGGGMAGGGLPPPEGPPHGLLLEAASNKVLLPSRGVLAALMALPLVLWLLAVGAGVLHWEAELPDGASKREFEHPLTWFDVHVLRVWGPLLPLLPLAVRVVAMGVRPSHSPASLTSLASSSSSSSSSSPLSPAAGGALRRPPLPLRPAASLPGACAGLYTLVIAARIGLYLAHLGLQAGAGVYLVSDHLLLAASMLACFQAELVMCASDAFKAELLRPRDPRVGAGARQVAVIAAFVSSAFLLVALFGDMYATARWFHARAESLGALAAGAALFNGPVALWLWRVAACVTP